MPQYFNTRTKQIIASPENFDDKQLADLGYTREKPADFAPSGTKYKSVYGSDDPSRNIFAPVNIAEDIVGSGNNIVGGDSRLRNEKAKNQADGNNILTDIDQYDTGNEVLDMQDFTDTPEYKKSNAELEAARKALGILTPEEQAQIEREAAAAGLEYDPLIRKAQEDKRQGFAKARVGAGEAGGFMNTQFAGLAALVPTEGGDFAGAGGELERVKSAYDQVISGLESQKRAAIERARSAARQAILTGKKDQYDIAKGEFDRVKGLYDSQLSLAKEKATALQNVTKMKQEQIKFTWEYAKEITGAYIDVLDDGSISVPTDEEINRIARERGLDAATVKSYLNQRIDELRKLNIEERKLEIQTTKDTNTSDINEYEYAKKQGYTGSFYEWIESKKAGDVPQSYREWELAGKPNTYADWIKQKNMVGELPTAVATRVDKIANNFDNEQVVKSYNTVQEGYQFAKSLSTDSDSSADDIGLIYAFAKAMDPNSVVREGEYATVQKYSQSWAQSFGFNALRVVDNVQFLSKEARVKIKETIKKKYDAINTQYTNLYNEYGRRIDRITGNTNGKDYLSNYGGAFNEQTGSSSDLLPEL